MSERVKRFDGTQWRELFNLMQDQFGVRYRNSDYVFRGEGKMFPQVVPLIDRMIPRCEGQQQFRARLEAEFQAILRFRQNAPTFLNGPQRRILRDPGMAVQTVMRHYSAPTRLLDWTESAWIALYFACADAAFSPAAELNPGRVMGFDRTRIQHIVAENHPYESQFHAASLPTTRGLVPKLLLPEFAEPADAWVVCYHHHGEKFPRLVAQQGLFTIASRPWLDHWDLAKATVPDHWIEIQIAPTLKMTVLSHLATMGISAATLFPDIHGVAHEVGEYIRQVCN